MRPSEEGLAIEPKPESGKRRRKSRNDRRILTLELLMLAMFEEVRFRSCEAAECLKREVCRLMLRMLTPSKGSESLRPPHVFSPAKVTPSVTGVTPFTCALWCHLSPCQHRACVHFRRALESHAKRFFHISHNIGLHRSAHCALTPQSMIAFCLFPVYPLSGFLRHHFLKILQNGLYLTVWNSLHVFQCKIGIPPLNSSFRGTQGSLHLIDKGWRSSTGHRSVLRLSAGFGAYSTAAAIYMFLISSFMPAISF